EAARGAGADSPEARMILADVSLRIHGPLAAASGRLPAPVNAALADALAALDVLAARGGDALDVATSRARVLLALGRADEAFFAADRALGKLAADAPKERVA